MSDQGALWIVGGLDPSGGAGVLRDVATARAFAPRRVVHVVVTTLTRQGDGRPATAIPLSEEQLRAQFERAPAPAAIKVGLVPGAGVAPLCSLLAEHEVPRVVDPVLAASAGGALGTDASEWVALFAGAVVTPNQPEFHAFADGVEPDIWARQHGCEAVLLKGGHADDPATVTDVLWSRGVSRRLTRPRCGGPQPRGTGCALATAIACGLADGQAVESAVELAVAWLDVHRQQARSVGRQTLL